MLRVFKHLFSYNESGLIIKNVQCCVKEDHSMTELTLKNCTIHQPGTWQSCLTHSVSQPLPIAVTHSGLVWFPHFPRCSVQILPSSRRATLKHQECRSVCGDGCLLKTCKVCHTPCPPPIQSCPPLSPDLLWLKFLLGLSMDLTPSFLSVCAVLSRIFPRFRYMK